MNQQYYQVFENNHPLINANFETIKGARDYLKNIAHLIQSSDNVPPFTVYERRLSHLPLRNILWLKRLYADGHEENVTLMIKEVKLSPFNNNF
jgi:hypothetical protein